MCDSDTVLPVLGGYGTGFVSKEFALKITQLQAVPLAEPFTTAAHWLRRVAGCQSGLLVFIYSAL